MIRRRTARTLTAALLMSAVLGLWPEAPAREAAGPAAASSAALDALYAEVERLTEVLEAARDALCAYADRLEALRGPPRPVPVRRAAS